MTRARQESESLVISEVRRQRAGLARTARHLFTERPLPEKLRDAARSIRDALSNPETISVWLELDGEVYGDQADASNSPDFACEILIAEMGRGRLCLKRAASDGAHPEEETFLEEAAALIGLAVAAHQREEFLRDSERRHKRLAGNLAQEMWHRTDALAKETSYLHGILNSSDDMIITTDLESRIVQFNPGAERMLGYSAEEMQGRPVQDVWVNAEERNGILKQVMAKGGVRNYETRLKTKSGEPREISLTLSLLKNAEGEILGTVGVSKDISREKKITRELERLNQDYRETIGFISHESKNSLMVMGGFLRRLLESETDPERKKQLEIVFHHSKFLEAMSGDFLVMAQLEREKIRVNKRIIEDFYMEVVYPAMVGLRDRYPDSFRSYDTSMGGVSGVQVPGDPSLLEIVFRNLFGNALKYCSPGGKIAYGFHERDDAYVFNVWNEGPGVPPEEKEKIFEKFYRVENENTRKKRGTGLGLYNIRRIIKAHGGEIWCETQPGKWINFLFTLPKNDDA